MSRTKEQKRNQYVSLICFTCKNDQTKPIARSMQGQIVFNCNFFSLKAKVLVCLTFGGAVDDLVLLLCVLQDALGAEHVSVLHAVELYFLAGMADTILDLALGHLARRHGWVGRRRHGQTCQHLVVYGQVVRGNLVRTLVVRALDDSVLGEFADTL